MARTVLKLRVRRTPRKTQGAPVRRRLRRSSSWIWITGVLALAAVVGGGAAGALLLAARGRPARFDMVRAGAAVRRAELFVRQPSPASAEHLAQLLRRAESMPADGGRETEPWNEMRAVAWAEALLHARRYAAEEIERRAEARRRWSVLEPEAARALERTREQVRAPGLGRREAAQLQGAEIELAAARRYAEAGAHDRALDAAGEALAGTAAIERRWLEIHARFREPELLSWWRGMVSETLEESRRSGRSVLIVDKLARRLEVYSAARLREVFQAELGSRGLARKLHSGDRATPEGRYRVTAVKSAPATKYYKALLLDYPNSEDRRRYSAAKSRGEVPPAAGIGGLIEIHGHGGRGHDWTDGCVALTDDDMDRLFRHVRVGTPVTIVGTVPRDAR